MRSLLVTLLVVLPNLLKAQVVTLTGNISANGRSIESATIVVKKHGRPVLSDSTGNFTINELVPGNYQLSVSAIGYFPHQQTLQVKEGSNYKLQIVLRQRHADLEDVVVTGTLKEVKRSESPVSVEVYTPAFFKKIQPVISMMLCKM